MSERTGSGRRAERGVYRAARGRAVAERYGGGPPAWPPSPAAADRAFSGGVTRAPDNSVTTEHIIRRGGTTWSVWRSTAEDVPRLRLVSSEGRSAAPPPIASVAPAAPAPTGGVALWCSMAAMAQQLAAANARQARARQALERQNAQLERENARLVAEVEDAAELLAHQAEEHAAVSRRTRWLISGLSLAVAALGALLLVLGPLAAVSRLVLLR